MTLLRTGIAVLAGMLMLAGCAGPSQRDIARALDTAGCGGVPAAEYQRLSDRVVLSVSVQGCMVSGSHGSAQPASRAESVRAMSRAIWTTSTLWFDSIFVTVYRTAEDPDRTRPQSVEISRDQLTAELGPRNPGLESRGAPGDGGRAAWTIIPLGVGVVGLMLLAGLARSVRTGRVALMWIIGR